MSFSFLRKFAAITALTLVSVNSTQADDAKMNNLLKKLDVDANAFVDGNLHFIAYHELAHAMISEFDLPVLGREEDGADRLAVLLMTPQEQDQEPQYLVAAMQGWFQTASEVPLNDISWWEQHGTDQQRGFQIACLLYGADTTKYKTVAVAVDLPESRLETCEAEASQNEKSWDSLLEKFILPEGQPAPTTNITIKYDPTTTYASELTYLKDAGLLEHISELMQTNYTFKPGIKITATECDNPNAYWNAENREMIMCYELVDLYRKLAEN
jgi:Putative metallopeptidase